MLNRLEVLADAIAWNHGAHEITTPAYLNRNPGNLKAFAAKHERDVSGLRVFNSLLDGYQAFLFDLRLKCAGQSNTVARSATLTDLMTAYGRGESAAATIAKRIRKVVGVEVTATTPLSFFVQETHNA